MADATAVRVLAAAAMILPIAFFMGMPFPLGILEIAAKPRGAVAWAWSMNGLFPTIGSVAAVLLSLWVGFRGTMLVAIGMYALASATFAAIRRGNRRQEHEIADRSPSAARGSLDHAGVAALWNTSSTRV